MEYNAPVLAEVGSAENLVLGFEVGSADGTGTGISLLPDLAVGLDE